MFKIRLGQWKIFMSESFKVSPVLHDVQHVLNSALSKFTFYIRSFVCWPFVLINGQRTKELSTKRTTIQWTLSTNVQYVQYVLKWYSSTISVHKPILNKWNSPKSISVIYFRTDITHFVNSFDFYGF